LVSAYISAYYFRRETSPGHLDMGNNRSLHSTDVLHSEFLYIHRTNVYNIKPHFLLSVCCILLDEREWALHVFEQIPRYLSLFGTFEALAIFSVVTQSQKECPDRGQSTLPRVISLVLQGLSESHEDLCVFLMRDTHALGWSLQYAYYSTFLLPPVCPGAFSAANLSPANFVGSALVFCPGFEFVSITSPIVATIASLTRRMTAPHANTHACMLTLPKGALGKERSHSA
jgi:hypothetical protein